AAEEKILLVMSRTISLVRILYNCSPFARFPRIVDRTPRRAPPATRHPATRHTEGPTPCPPPCPTRSVDPGPPTPPSSSSSDRSGPTAPCGTPRSAICHAITPWSTWTSGGTERPRTSPERALSPPSARTWWHGSAHVK